MAKSGVLEQTGQLMVASKAVELKEELQRLVRAIVDDDDYTAENEAVRVLTSLKELKLKKTSSLKLEDNSDVPEEFKCPISKEIMRDPVVLATGLRRKRVSEKSARPRILVGFSHINRFWPQKV